MSRRIGFAVVLPVATTVGHRGHASLSFGHADAGGNRGPLFQAPLSGTAFLARTKYRGTSFGSFGFGNDHRLRSGVASSARFLAGRCGRRIRQFRLSFAGPSVYRRSGPLSAGDDRSRGLSWAHSPYPCKVQAPGTSILTSQLYFPGEVRNQTDWLFRRDLLVMVIDAGKAMRARFDFVVAGATDS